MLHDLSNSGRSYSEKSDGGEVGERGYPMGVKDLSRKKLPREELI